MKKSPKRFTALITGVPGTGKTTAAKLLSQKTCAALIDINKLVEVAKLYESIDESDGAKVANLKLLQLELSAAIKSEKRSLLVEGHLGCEFPLTVQKAIVLRCDPSVLRSRLSARNYPLEKTSQNALAEALDYCTALCEKNYGKRKVWEIDTTALSPQQVADRAERIIGGKIKKKARVSFPDALLKEAISGEKIRQAFK